MANNSMQATGKKPPVPDTEGYETGVRTALWRCVLGDKLPLMADGSPRPKAVVGKMRKQTLSDEVRPQAC